MVLVSYVIGCVLGAYYIVRLRSGVDVRATGSGNAGAKNVLRSGDKLGAVLTLAWDAAKAALAVWVGFVILPTDWAGSLAFLGVILGHVFPAQLRFHGGKGAAPSLGAALVVDWRATLVALAIGAVAGAVARNSSVFGLTAIGATPIALAWRGASWLNVAGTSMACAIVLLAHLPAVDRRRQPATLTTTPQELHGGQS